MLVWMAFGWILSYVVTAVWTTEAFASFIAALNASALMKMPFALFLVCAAGNLLRASRSRLKQGRSVFMLWVLLPAGLLLYLTGFLLSVSMRESAFRTLGEGDPVQPPWSTAASRIVRIDLGLPETFLDIDLNRGAGIFQYEPKVFLQDENGRKASIGVFPASSHKGTYYHILNFGIAPMVRMQKGAEVIEESFIPLKILTPGSNDSIGHPAVPFLFQVSMEPERVIEKGETTASEYRPLHPRYAIRAYEGGKIVAEARNARAIEHAGFSLTLGDPTVWVQLEAVRDRWYPLLVAGLFMTFAGLAARAALFLFSLFRRNAAEK